MNQTIPRQTIAFAKIAATFGGAVSATYSSRFVWVTLPGQAEVVRLSRSALPEPGKWSAFTLADACKDAKLARRVHHHIPADVRGSVDYYRSNQRARVN